MKTFFTFIAIIIVAGVVSAGIQGTKKNIGAPATGGTPLSGLQVCPDEKIDNRMPGIGGQNTSYYNVDGERKEISEFDASWVAANCSVPTQVVY